MYRNHRKMWQSPWGYKESIVVVIGLIVVGFALQLAIGKFDFLLLQFPVNLILCVITIIGLLILSLFRKNAFYQWFSGIPFSVALIVAILILTIIMGLTPQLSKIEPSQHDLFTRLGFRQLTSSWAFVLIYFVTLLSLGALIIRRIITFKLHDYAFYLNHIGLWILLFSAGMGASDFRRYVMHVREGEVEWRVYNDKKDMLELPIAIQLNDFDMEVYPPKITIIDRTNGEAQPVGKPDYYQIDMRRPKNELFGWDIEVLNYIHDAVRNSDSTYHEVHMPGASPAAKIIARNRKTGTEKQGWICSGNSAQLYMTLPLDSQYIMVMTQPEPKRYVSDITVFTENGEDAHAQIEVNKPLTIGSWTIYQYGYDNEAGRMSTYSSLELVYDPWVYPVYSGIALLSIGSVCFLWLGSKKRKKKKYDLE